MFKFKTALKSGDLVEIKNKVSGALVYKGFILGMNEKVVITSEFNTTPQTLKANVVLNMDSSLVESNFFRDVLHDKSMGTPFCLDQGASYREFLLKDHDIITIEENTSDVKAHPCNNVYDFVRNKWMIQPANNSHLTVFTTDDSVSPMNGVIVLSVGSENLYCVKNGIQFSLKFPFIDNWKEMEVGLYNFMQSSENAGFLSASLIQSYEQDLRSEWISKLELKSA